MKTIEKILLSAFILFSFAQCANPSDKQEFEIGAKVYAKPNENLFNKDIPLIQKIRAKTIEELESLNLPKGDRVILISERPKDIKNKGYLYGTIEVKDFYNTGTSFIGEVLAVDTLEMKHYEGGVFLKLKLNPKLKIHKESLNDWKLSSGVIGNEKYYELNTKSFYVNSKYLTITTADSLLK